MKEKDKEVEKAVEVGHDQVEEALLAKFDTMKSEEAEIQGMICLKGVYKLGNKIYQNFFWNYCSNRTVLILGNGE